MAMSLHHGASYHGYPYLTPDEFAEVCHCLDRRYRQATLGPLRQRWRLDLHSALDTSPTATGHPLTFLQIATPLRDSPVDAFLADRLQRVSLDPGPDTDLDLDLDLDTTVARAEHADTEVAPRQSRSRRRRSIRSSYALYEIHLHPTYRVPCLWFALHNLPLDESPLDVDTVFRRLVPPHLAGPLRRQGPVPAISIDHHPITGLPSFFIHPCLLGDAMAPFRCAKEDYLMVWIGLVGACVGLTVPTDMATAGQP